jgi:hypothetical protein
LSFDCALFHLNFHLIFLHFMITLWPTQFPFNLPSLHFNFLMIFLHFMLTLWAFQVMTPIDS